MTDGELVALCRGGDGAAWEELYKRYKPLVLSVSRKFYLFGGDSEDIVQEGMCGLCSAVMGFTGDRSFAPYARSCIKNRIIDAVKRNSNYKNAALNDFMPISESEGLYSADDPEGEVIARETRGEFIKKMGTALSALEFKTMVMYIDGLSMNEIASALGLGFKSVDNALSRAKRKIQKMEKEE